MIDLKKIKR